MRAMFGMVGFVAMGLVVGGCSVETEDESGSAGGASTGQECGGGTCTQPMNYTAEYRSNDGTTLRMFNTGWYNPNHVDNAGTVKKMPTYAFSARRGRDLVSGHLHLQTPSVKWTPANGNVYRNADILALELPGRSFGYYLVRGFYTNPQGAKVACLGDHAVKDANNQDQWYGSVGMCESLELYPLSLTGAASTARASCPTNTVEVVVQNKQKATVNSLCAPTVATLDAAFASPATVRFAAPNDDACEKIYATSSLNETYSSASSEGDPAEQAAIEEFVDELQAKDVFGGWTAVKKAQFVGDTTKFSFCLPPALKK